MVRAKNELWRQLWVLLCGAGTQSWTVWELEGGGRGSEFIFQRCQKSYKGTVKQRVFVMCDCIHFPSWSRHSFYSFFSMWIFINVKHIIFLAAIKHVRAFTHLFSIREQKCLPRYKTAEWQACFSILREGWTLQWPGAQDLVKRFCLVLQLPNNSGK